MILWDAESRGTLTTDQGRITWRSFVHAADMAIVVELQTSGDVHLADATCNRSIARR
jgi:hypothetical protein